MLNRLDRSRGSSQRRPPRGSSQRRPSSGRDDWEQQPVRRSGSDDPMRQKWDALLPHLLKIDGDSAIHIKRLQHYAQLLSEWNRSSSNLISRADMPRLVEHHILESIEPAHWLASSGARHWLDFGSGGGLPALPLIIVGIGEKWTLVESRRNKTLFLRRVVQELGLTNTTVVCDRLENLAGDDGLAGSVEGFTSRATLVLGPTLVLAERFVQPGGAAFLWKGSRREEEMAADPRWKAFWDLDGLLGLSGSPTVVARFKRISI
ncbi:MAG TPA: 16S rRNA (guanine(527)-N(7))-methyltransferase RsmG [Candidatus Saccharimonadaceae bacterium]|nr:16S rRNA (guanine(527)-N(7))-methyltransferase RsmG [Candidatus Saccharimonadaceae bacterium]